MTELVLLNIVVLCSVQYHMTRTRTYINGESYYNEQKKSIFQLRSTNSDILKKKNTRHVFYALE